MSSDGAAMRDGHVTAPPAGWLGFCERNSGDPYCRPVDITTARFNELQRIHSEVRALGKQADAPGTDIWTVSTSEAGDCEDHALTVRAKLLAAGWPPRSLRLATGWTEKGIYHAVLTIDGRRGGALVTYVIDSRYAAVHHWQDLDYRWDRRQAAGQPFWITVA
ncbi:transglutaminase-like cysteine peptidase [Sphingoaurantiacus capsulatus]|uniref:Transglutaminase-like cysteine peptidase n=1 Tax=Sphingoaurantiacus capsulatus TaxID=1771310 RepID=A0ABV7XGH3_9SPHN